MNRRVRCAAGVDGTVVILSAWCRKCRQESMPDCHGVCSWCETRIVDEDTLSSNLMLDQISRRGPTAREEMHAPPAAVVAVHTGSGSPAVPRAEVASRPGKRPTPRKWTRHTQLDAIRRWAAVNGRPPTQVESCAGNGLPPKGTLAHEFGSFAAAIEAAGFPRPSRGRRKASGGVDVRFPAAPPPEDLLEALKVA